MEKLKDLHAFRPNAGVAPDVTSTVYMSSTGYKQLIGCEGGKNLYWTTDINNELPIKMGISGPSAEIPPMTIPEAFMMRANSKKNKPVMRVMRDKKVYTWHWNQFVQQVMAVAKSIEALGIDQRKAVNIMGYNSPEWAIAFFGSVFHNNPVSGVYITNGA